MSEPLVLKARIAADPERVSRAITDPAELRGWLADHVESDAATFAFWGPTIPEGDAPHQRLITRTPTELTFGWRVGGEDTTVSLVLAEAADGGTSLTLTQSHFPGWAVAASREGGVLALLGTIWGLVLANLVEYVEGRPLTPRQDLTSSELRAEVVIAADAARVYDALVDPARFEEWFGHAVGIEPWVGGRWAMGGLDVNPNPATITVLEPGHGLTLDFGSGFGVTSWELAESDGRTRLTMVQSGFDPANPPYGGWCGWLSGIAELRRYLEQAAWRSTWVDLEQVG
ncbi:SRPBCC family protein [Actinokineospora enzanensis]|uniref:SRPBCC family protein n=1 Tax=Actinokineospora enzanensis TaxID=155975 RepID=UPI00035CFB01|nr:SRPBCC domain-containing protein [Actinokineospora enzanensis]